MPDNATDRRCALRDRLTVIAEARIAADGLRALRARDLAAEAGCAVGAIYNVFGDLDDLVLTVNARTFRRMGATVAAAREQAGVTGAAELVVMAQAYHHFAARNFNLWRALFDLERPTDEAAPAWYLAEMGRLMEQIERPLAQLFPAMSPNDRNLTTRAFFSAVHGIVLLGLDRASAGVPVAEIDRMLALVLAPTGHFSIK